MEGSIGHISEPARRKILKRCLKNSEYVTDKPKEQLILLLFFYKIYAQQFKTYFGRLKIQNEKVIVLETSSIFKLRLQIMHESRRYDVHKCKRKTTDSS